MAKFDGSRLDVIEYDLTAPIDFRPNPDAPDLDDDERERRRQSIAHGAWTCESIPEPAQDRVREFFAALQDARLEVAEIEQKAQEEQLAERRSRWLDAHADKRPGPVREAPKLPTDDELIDWESVSQLRANIAALQSARENAAHTQRGRIEEAIAEFTENHPGVDVLGYLPYRTLENFLGWLSGHFSPEAAGAASRI